jgi:hypothetical protein
LARITYGGFTIGEDPQPSRQGSNSPTGLIGVDDTALPDHFKQLFINGFGCVGKFLISLAPATATHLQSKGILENFTHFAVRDAQPMFEINCQRFGSRSPNSRSRCLRNLIWMARPHSFVAFATITTVCYEVGCLHLNQRNIRFILIVFVYLAHLTTTLRTPVQFGGLRFRDLLDRRLGSMGKLTLPFLAPRLLRSLHPFPTSERHRLAFPGSLQLLHFLLKLLDYDQSLSQLLLQFSDPLIFRVRKFVFAPFSTHRHQFTFLRSTFARVFLPYFFKTFDTLQNSTFGR